MNVKMFLDERNKSAQKYAEIKTLGKDEKKYWKIIKKYIYALEITIIVRKQPKFLFCSNSSYGNDNEKETSSEKEYINI